MLERSTGDTGVAIAIIALTVIAAGIVMVSSSSMALSDHDFNGPFHHTISHIYRVLIGFLLALAVYLIGIKTIKKLSLILLVFSLFMGSLIFVPGLSVEVNGAVRWLDLGGLVFQPYDLFKLAYIVFLAHALEAYHKNGNSRGLLFALGILLLAAFFLLMQPDFGSLFMLVGVVMIAGFMAAGFTRYYLYTAIVLLALAVWLVLSVPYRLQRVLTLFDPWSDRYGSGFQLIQAMVAEGSGGISGVGLGESVQKMLYIPEVHTDFTISVLAEESGIIGVMAIIGLVVWLYVLLMSLSRRLWRGDSIFEAYVITLAANFIFLQSMFNIGVNYGLLPTKGITLPFMGYGGTSIVSHIVMIGLVLACARSVTKSRASSDMRARTYPSASILTVR